MNILLTFVILFTISSINASEVASFYGTSYISLPLQEASANNTIEFKFKTWLSDALFVLIAGKTDFCMVQLDDGLLKVRVNLGAGEEELSSPAHHRLDNGEWHAVKVVRKDASLTLEVDATYTTKTTLPGPFFELNIQYGIFVGNDGHFKEQFLGRLVGLRGCMADLTYSGMDLLHLARRRQGNSKVYSVTWNCDSIFEASTNAIISFIDNNAFLALEQPIGRGGARWQFELKTGVNNSLLLYNSGQSLQAHVIAMELHNGLLSLLANNGRTNQITNKVFVADNKWHKVTVQFNPVFLELTVDNYLESKKIVNTVQKSLDLTNLFYVGGLEMSLKSRATVKGVNTSDLSFKGCIRRISVNDELIGLSNARASLGITSGKRLCTDNFSDSATDLNIVSTDPVVVTEGGRTILNDSHIHIIVDYYRWNVRDTMIIFQVLNSSQGNVMLHKLNSTVKCGSFTLADLYGSKVEYQHDGTDNGSADDTRQSAETKLPLNSINLEIKFGDNPIHTMPTYLQQRKLQFALPVHVTPINDPPNVTAGVLRMLKGSRQIVTNRTLNATDPDSSPSHITYMTLTTKPNESHIGQFESANYPNQPIQRFTQADINAQQVVFFHTGQTDRHHSTKDRTKPFYSELLFLDVTDGISPNQTVALKIHLYNLELGIQTNTSFVMTYNVSQVITRNHLAFTSKNFVDPALLDNVRLNVVKAPEFGVIECGESDGGNDVRELDNDEKDDGYSDVLTWSGCAGFFVSNIANHQVRYRHVSGAPKGDFFQFEAILDNESTSPVYNFTVTFVKLQLKQSNFHPLLINGSQHYTITSQSLRFTTQPVELPSFEIHYTILNTPKYGRLLSFNNVCSKGDSFTQYDIDRLQLQYSLHQPTYSFFNDSISFFINARNLNVTKKLNIKYSPSPRQVARVHVTKSNLQVIEGERGRIEAQHLNIDFDVDKASKTPHNLVYNVLTPPEHGAIMNCQNCTIVTSCHCDTVNTSFTASDLAKNTLFYQHDDSETRQDHFDYKAEFLWEGTPAEDFQYFGRFQVNVLLKNDHPPERVTNRVFQVVVDHSRLITSKDLKYEDADVNTLPSAIVFTCQSVTNGMLYNATTMERITTFTQQDINSNTVLFKHHGDEYGKILLWITDTQFFINGELDVYASRPYVKILVNDIIVQSGKRVTLTADMISVDTNLNVLNDFVIYNIVKVTKHGFIKFTYNNEMVKQFTQADLENQRVYYVHNNLNTYLDNFILHVNCNGTITEAKISIRILSTVYWDPLILLSPNDTLVVEEATSVTINRMHLEILHPDITPQEIKYYVTKPPQFGYLRLKQTITSDSISVFDQAAINTGRLQYIQNAANQTHDLVKFNVTNGITWLNNVTLHIEIIPEHFYIRTITLNVTEGQSAVITKGHVQVITKYYEDKVTHYAITQLPKNGWIYLGNDNESVQKFTDRDLSLGVVRYLHDGSEKFHDNFTVVAYTDRQESEPAILNVLVEQTNDEAPLLVNNTGLDMWEGGCAVINNTHLAAVDLDIPEDIIIFKVTASWWGTLALRTTLETFTLTPTNIFTQEQLDNNLIYFNHTNGTLAKFTFRLTDNIHTSSDHTFEIRTHPVKLNIINNTKIHAFPLTKEKITHEHLCARTSDPQRNVFFTITRPAAHGRVLIYDRSRNTYHTVRKFSQDDIDGGIMFYEHTHAFNDLYANDSFVFDLEAKLASRMMDLEFHIDISVSSGALDTYVTVNPITIDEGGTGLVSINMSGVVGYLEHHTNVPAPIIHAVVWPPQHGVVFTSHLENREFNLVQSTPGSTSTATSPRHNITILTEDDFARGFVKYQHDHSDTTKDDIVFTLYLLPDYIMLCNVTLPVKINPINDQQFQLITQAPSLSVVQGENATITNTILLTEDADTDPAHLVYDIITEPTEGQIVLAPDNYPVTLFTQRDINDGRVVYKHSGSKPSVTFHFRVWDGKFKPEYKVFSIQVLPIHVELIPSSPIYMQQGQNVAKITANHLTVRANINPILRLSYQVVSKPKYGVIYVNDVIEETFTHRQLVDHAVIYMQNKMDVENDTFVVAARVKDAMNDGSNNISLAMVVQPLMQRGNFTAYMNTFNRITTGTLDATPLAELTASNPSYSIVRPPSYGTINKIIRNSGDRKIVYNQEIDGFTHEDVKIGLVYYVCKADRLANMSSFFYSGVEDSFTFRLQGTIFQPAFGELRFKIYEDIINPELNHHKDMDSNDNTLMASPYFYNNYLSLLMIGVGFMFVVVVLFFLVRCRSLDLSKDESTHIPDSYSQPLPLPRPPEHLMSSSPHLKRYMDDDDFMLSMPMPLSVHHYKLPPLGPFETSLMDPDLEGHSHYPYGSYDDNNLMMSDEWDSMPEEEPDIIIENEDLYTDNGMSVSSSEPHLRQHNLTSTILNRDQYWV